MMESIVELGGALDTGDVVVHEVRGMEDGDDGSLSRVENMSILSDEPESPASAKARVKINNNNNNNNNNSRSTASEDRHVPYRSVAAMSLAGSHNSAGDNSDADADEGGGGGGGSASVRSDVPSIRSVRSTKSTSSSRSVLTRRVVKRCPNGDLFSGLADAVTGEPVEGRLTSAKTGEVYEGPFVRGRRHGDGGHSNRLDGSKFFGSFRNGDPYEGTLITASYTYQGRLLVPQPSTKADIFHGPAGTLLHKNGDIYQGAFSHGRYSGKGRERTISGLNYTGQYRSGKWHGMGDLIVERRANDSANANASNAAHAVAAPAAAAPHGSPAPRSAADSGLPFNPDAFRYTYYGEWQHGEREGTGSERIVFGSKNRRSAAAATAAQGQGHNQAQTTHYSSAQSGASSSSRASSSEERLRKRTATFEGEFHRDRRHGSGILALPDGTVVEGMWKNGLPATTAEDGEQHRDIGMSDSSENDHHHHHHHKGGVRFSRHINDAEADRRSRRKGGRNKRSSSAAGGGGDGAGGAALWKIDYPNGDKYRGECARAPLSVAGSQSDGMKAHLNIYTSSRLPVVPHGTGTMTYAKSGDAYEGSFRLGRRHGFGRCIHRMSGEEFDGTWVDDLPGEVGGQRLHLFQPLFDCSVAPGDQQKGHPREEGVTANGALDYEVQAGGSVESAQDVGDLAVKASRPTLEDRVHALFGGGQLSARKSKSSEGSHASIGSESTPPMANTNRIVKPPTPSEEDHSRMAGDSPMVTKTILSREDERTLSTDALSISSS